MREISCAHCGTIKMRNTGEVNRALRLGNALYCSRECGNAARSSRKKDTAWHKRRFEERPNAIRTECAECHRPMWLPPSKVGEYKRCGPECNRAWHENRKSERDRACETCGKQFRPRAIQIANGGGRFCSQACNPTDHLITPQALARAQQAKRDAIAAGTVAYPKGPDNKQWMGGREASVKRRTESGKSAASVRRYRAANPHKTREWKQRRGKGKVLPRIPYGTIPRLGGAQRWKCAICRTGIRSGYHVDHIQPIAKGGKHEPRNLQLLCASCNIRKSAKDPIAYMQEVGRLL